MSKDSATVNLYETSNGGRFEYEELDAGANNEALKITSQATDIEVRGKRILGGAEDCLDLNDRCRDIDVHFDEWAARGKYVVTCKGGCRGIRLSGTITSHGAETDVDLGNHSDQSAERTTAVRLNLATNDGSAVRVRVLHAHQPVIENPSQRYEIDVAKKGWFGHIWPILKAIAALFGRKI